ncbi:hypothetical protein, partial [Natronolimnohabitans innermongolicus]
VDIQETSVFEYSREESNASREMPGFENPHDQANETKTLERPAETLTVSLEIELDGEFAADLSVPQGEIDAALESG